VSTVDILLGVPLLVASGTVAGVLFSVALSVVPAFLDLPPDRYIEVHKLIGRRYDRVMPPLVATSVVLDAVLAATTAGATCRALFASAAVLACGVAAVSQLGNVPLNRRVKSIPAGCVPADWDDPRARWRTLNLVRTSLAVLALVASSSALLLAR
jgi:uncharacterized membrane protein